MVARLKLKGIDGRAPPVGEPAEGSFAQTESLDIANCSCWTVGVSGWGGCLLLAIP